MRNLAAADPQRALSVLEANSAQDRQILLGQIASEWSRADPAEAKAWIESLPIRDRTTAMGASMAIFMDDPQWGITQIAKLPISGNTYSIVGNFTRKRVERDPDGAIEWVKSLPLGHMREAAHRNLFDGWIKKDPAAAAAYLTSEEVLENVGQGWIEVDPGAAKAAIGEAEISDDMKAKLLQHLPEQNQ